MKQVIYRKLSNTILRLSFVFLVFSNFLYAQEGDPANGKTLFNAKCAACHKLDKKSIGPALGNLEQRLADEQGLGKDWIFAWTRNSTELIASGDEYANKVFEENGKIPMQSFADLTDADLNDILAYTAQKEEAVKKEAAPADAPEPLTAAQEEEIVKGKSLFNTNCAACHKLDKKMTGPALRGVEQRLEDEGLDRAWIYAWVRNSSAVVKSGDAYANKIYNEYGGAAMTAFPQLSDEELNSILAYTNQVKVAPKETVIVGSEDSNEGGSEDMMLIVLVALFAVLAIILLLVYKKLRSSAISNNVEVSETKTLWKAFAQNQFLVLVTAIFFLLASAYFVYGYFMQVGVDQGYQPVQPIHFSHRIHAGDNGIDCKYCHSSARVSKTSGIPSLNVCMNCHKSIYEVASSTATAEHSKEFYDGEIKKLYDASGWSDADQKYTGEPKPVKWVRIHNLPAFAYYNHSQHITVAGIECQTCHGPVEEMEEVYQYSPLTMGWCINCHRETDVKVKDNGYYEKIHEELKQKYGVDTFTAAEMGAQECGKCHY